MVSLLMSGVSFEPQDSWAEVSMIRLESAGQLPAVVGDTRMDEITLQPIGLVCSPVTERMDANWGETRAKIVLNPELAGALLGLEEFSHAIIVTYLHQASF